MHDDGASMHIDQRAKLIVQRRDVTMPLDAHARA